MKVSERQFQWGAWAITVILCTLAVMVYGQGIKWDVSRLSSYRLFPLFGLLTFSIFLSHYLVSVKRQYLGISKEVIKSYYLLSSFAALGFLLLHPSLFIGQLWLDGFGLPPGSYKAYVGTSLVWAVLLGTVSFLFFLSYELLRSKRFKPWQPYLQALSDIAMVFILIHGWYLGSHIQSTWFKSVWLGYSLLLVICLIYTYGHKVQQKLRESKENTQ